MNKIRMLRILSINKTRTKICKIVELMSFDGLLMYLMYTAPFVDWHPSHSPFNVSAKEQPSPWLCSQALGTASSCQVKYITNILEIHTNTEGSCHRKQRPIFGFQCITEWFLVKIDV